jgi:hypothetical protein
MNKHTGTLSTSDYHYIDLRIYYSHNIEYTNHRLKHIVYTPILLISNFYMHVSFRKPLYAQLVLAAKHFTRHEI